jgi:hypothetical protein
MSNSRSGHRFEEIKGEEDMLLKEMLLVFRLSRNRARRSGACGSRVNVRASILDTLCSKSLQSRCRSILRDRDDMQAGYKAT